MRPLFLLALGACAEPASDMSLKLPQMPSNFDLSCVTAVDVAAHADSREPFDIGIRLFERDQRDPCVDIEPETTFEGIREQLRGRVEFDLTDDLAAIQIRGGEGTCEDFPNFHEAIFYGGANFNDGDVTLPLVPNISCTARETYKVRPLDVAAMIIDPTHACKAAPSGGETFPAVYRPSMNELTPMIMEGGTGAAAMDALTGTATLQPFAGTVGNDACITVVHHVHPTIIGATCVNKSAPLLCAHASPPPSNRGGVKWQSAQLPGRTRRPRSRPDGESSASTSPNATPNAPSPVKPTVRTEKSE